MAAPTQILRNRMSTTATLSLLAPWIAAIVGLVLAFLVRDRALSRDLMALWLAADAVATGMPEKIYPPLDALFRMRPALDWYGWADEIGRSGEVYPYLYPPIWAYLLAPVTRLMSFDSFATLALWANATLLVQLPLIGARLTFTSSASLSARVLIMWCYCAFAFMYLAKGPLLALLQGQPQILVAALMLWSLLRAQRGHELQGGLAMGIAIALKLAPLPLALLWLATGQWRACVAALGTAGVLGLTSLALAGWSLHADFLTHLGAIDNTILVSGAVASLDLLMGTVLWLPQAELVTSMPSEISDITTGWAVIPKPTAYVLVQKALLLALLFGFALALRKNPDPPRRAALWAAAIASFAFVGPIGWLYYYILPLAMAPLIVFRLGPFGIFFPILAVLPQLLRESDSWSSALGVAAFHVTNAGVLALIAGYLIAAFLPSRRSPLSALRAGRS